MSVTRGLLRNAGVQMISQASTWILGWLFTFFLARHQGDGGFGRLFFAISLAMMAGIVVDLGINTFLVKEVARRPDAASRLLANALAIKAILGLLAYAVLVAIVRSMDVTAEAMVITQIIGVSAMVGAIGLTFGACLQGLQRSGVPAVGLIIDKSVSTLLAVVALSLGQGLIAVAWIFLLGSLASSAYMGWALSRQVAVRLRFEREQVRALLIGASPFLIWIVFGEIYIRIDVLMLTAMTSDEVVGWYGAAFRLYSALLFIPNIFMATVFPALARKFAQPGESANAASRRSFNLMLLVSVPVGVGTCVVADPMVSLFFGQERFAHAIENLQVFGLSMVFVCVNVVLGSVLIANERQKAWSLCAIGGAVINPLLNWLAIPLSQAHIGNGGYGAAVATLATEMFMLACAVRLLPAGIFDRSTLFTAFKAALSAWLMALVLQLLPALDVVSTIAIGGVVYAVAALALRVLPREDAAHLRHALARAT